MTNSIYLDYAAATPMSKSVQTAMEPYFSKHFYNPSAIYLSAKSVRKDINNAREQVAKLLGVLPGEIIFTAGGTEANNLAILGVAHSHPAHHIISTGLEHDSVRHPLENLAKKGWSYTEVKPDKTGIINPKDIASAITDKTILVSVMYANNEIGTIQPLRDISQAIKKVVEKRKKRGINLPIIFHADACQAVNYLDIHVNKLGVDLLTINGGKIYGPKQSGVLYVSKKVTLSTQIFGGGQENNIRSGTENIPAIIGLTQALVETQAMKTSETNRLKTLQTNFIKLLEKHIPDISINGSLKHRLPNNIHITIPGTDNERIIMELDEHGIQIAAGSACSASSEESSHVLKSIGLTDNQAQSSLRITMGRHTKPKDIVETVKVLSKLVA